MKLSIDYDICTGHGRCFMLAANLFDSDEDGRGVVLMPDVPEEEIGLARETSYSCPEQAVILTEE